MRKKWIILCMCIALLTEILLADPLNVKANEAGEPQEIKNAFQIAVTSTDVLEAGKEVTLDVHITNTTDKELGSISISHNYTWFVGGGGAQWFGEWYDENGTKISFENQNAVGSFAAGQSKTHKLVGTLPDDWGRKYCIDIFICGFETNSDVVYSGRTEYGKDESLYPSQDDFDNLNYEGYTVSMTADRDLKVGEQAVFQISITNRSGIVQKVNRLNHFYNSDYRNEVLIPNTGFGIMKDEQQNTVTEEAALYLVFQPGETKKFTLTGTIPEDWNEYGQIMIEVFSYGENGVWYDTIAAYPESFGPVIGDIVLSEEGNADSAVILQDGQWAFHALTKEEQLSGDSFKVVFHTDRVEIGSMDSSVKGLLLKSAGIRKIAAVFDMTIQKSNLSKTPAVMSNVKELAAPIQLTIRIPQEYYKESGRKFCVIRIHGGEAAVLEDLDDRPDTVTIRTDKFSYYALAYTDLAGSAATPSEGQNGSGSAQRKEVRFAAPQTGDAADAGLYLLISITLTAVIASIFLRKRHIL